MIMPCMNCTSAGERGGRVALVDVGNVLVGWPGAPGCTTTGCWAQTGCDKTAVRVAKATSPLCHVASPLTDRSLGRSLKYKEFIELISSTGDFNLSQGRTRVTCGTHSPEVPLLSTPEVCVPKTRPTFRDSPAEPSGNSKQPRRDPPEPIPAI